MILYDLIDIDRDVMVLCGVKQGEVQKRLGTIRSVNTIAKRGITTRGQDGHAYKIIFSGTDIPEQTTKLCEPSFREEWLNMQKMFKNVKWQKHWDVGVKQLSIRS